jgi:hypothetical protein
MAKFCRKLFQAKPMPNLAVPRGPGGAGSALPILGQ